MLCTRHCDTPCMPSLSGMPGRGRSSITPTSAHVPSCLGAGDHWRHLEGSSMRMSARSTRRILLEGLGHDLPPGSPLRRIIHRVKELGLNRRGGILKVTEICRDVNFIDSVIREFRREITDLKSQRDHARRQVCEFGCTPAQSQAYAKWRQWDCYSPQKSSFEI